MTQENERIAKIVAEVHWNRWKDFSWTSDKEVWGVPEHHPLRSEIPPVGTPMRRDCDDFAHACRWDLLEQHDIDSLLVVCRVTPGDPRSGHMVDYCRGWILDCRYRTPQLKSQVPYEWLMAGRPGLRNWRKIITEK